MERGGPAVGNVSDKKEGKDEMIKASVSLQDLRRRLYVKAKADASAGRSGVGDGCTNPWACLTATGFGAPRRKVLRHDRSHKLWGEANRRA